MKLFSSFTRAATIRAFRTFAQALLGYLGAAELFSEVDWGTTLSGAAFAALLSLLNAVATDLPEAPGRGFLNPDHSGPWTKEDRS